MICTGNYDSIFVQKFAETFFLLADWKCNIRNDSRKLLSILTVITRPHEKNTRCAIICVDVVDQPEIIVNTYSLR